MIIWATTQLRLAFDRLDWNSAVDFEGDGEFETLDPGAILTDPVDLSIDFESGLHFVVRGSVTGTGDEEELLVAGPVSIRGTAEFALSRWTLDVDTDGNGSTDLVDAELDTIALSSSGMGVVVDGVADLTVSGDLGLARISVDGTVRYTGLTLGDVVVTTNVVTEGFGLTGDLEIDYLGYNSAAATYDRLDWNSAVDFEGDGEFETLDPGAILTDPVDLSIDFESGLHFVVRGSVTGTGDEEELLVAGPVSIRGTAEFALSRWTLDVDTDGNGSTDLVDAELDTIALSSSGMGVVVDGVADLTVSGDLGLARISVDGTARYTGLTLGDVVVTTNVVTEGFGLTGDLEIDYLGYNSAAATYDRLDWNSAVDFEGDGEFETLDPGAILTDPVDLSIDFESGLHFVVRGSVTGTGDEEELLVAGPVSIRGTAEFALSRWTLDVDTDGNGSTDLVDAELDTIALSSSGMGVVVDGVADLTVSGDLGLARISVDGTVHATPV